MEKIYSIYHKALATDSRCYTSTLFRAKDKEDALAKYNQLALKRKDYPYMWNQVDIKNVSEAEIYS